jgi:hypothetical protein
LPFGICFFFDIWSLLSFRSLRLSLSLFRLSLSFSFSIALIFLFDLHIIHCLFSIALVQERVNNLKTMVANVHAVKAELRAKHRAAESRLRHAYNDDVARVSAAAAATAAAAAEQWSIRASAAAEQIDNLIATIKSERKRFQAEIAIARGSAAMAEENKKVKQREQKRTQKNEQKEKSQRQPMCDITAMCQKEAVSSNVLSLSAESVRTHPHKLVLYYAHDS